MAAPSDEIRAWLQKAYHDLLAARVLMRQRLPIYDKVCFHCQQAVEKALKALLLWKDIPFRRVHSLGYLLDLSEPVAGHLRGLRDRIEALAPYAVEIRYPGDLLAVSCEEARAALNTISEKS